MAKERMLTVLVPIKDTDATAVAELPVVNSDNINVIYKYDGAYYRVWLNPDTGFYEYHTVIDREFPYLGHPLEIFDFTYDAVRMGTAPTISAQDVKWYAEKDSNGEDVTLEDLWLERWQECHVVFNGENLYLKRIPTSGKNNEDARYKYDLDFVSEDVVLETTYIYDVVSPYITDRPVSESATFSFFGDVTELAKRINASLLQSGLSSLVRKDVYREWGQQSVKVPYVTYEEWNEVGKYMPQTPTQLIQQVYLEEQGNYSTYLQKYIYVNTDGDYVQQGYKVVLGKDKYGNDQTSEEKRVDFDKNYIQEGLQQVKDTFDLQYYITRERDGNGDFTGNILIVIGDCEHDFADMNAGGTDYVRDADGIPTTSHPFDYGTDFDNNGNDSALLSKEKTNTTDKIVTRITGVGSSENIPWYYPNPTGDGWIKPLFKIDGEESSAVTVGYPLNEGTTAAERARYEKYLKNRLGDVFQYGIRRQSITELSYMSEVSSISISTVDDTTPIINLMYDLNVLSGYTNPEFAFTLAFLKGGNLSYYVARLGDNTTSPVTYQEFDSSQTYANPTDFQQAFLTADGSVRLSLTAGHHYLLSFTIYTNGSLPLSKLYDYEGYYHPIDTVANPGTAGPDALVPDGFYSEQSLMKCAEFITHQGVLVPVWAGYSLDGTANGKIAEMQRIEDKHYKDISTGVIYRCKYSGTRVYYNDWDNHQQAYTQNAATTLMEWVTDYMRFNLWINSIDGNWYKNSKSVNLADYGLIVSAGAHTFAITDTIEFKRVKYLTPCKNLMPEVYIKTDGERRFYDAIQYPRTGTADAAIGEVSVGGEIVNPIYTDSNGTHYDFENVIMPSQPKEHIEDFEDIKASIKGQKNYLPVTLNSLQFSANKTLYYTYDSVSDEYIQCTEESVFSDSTQYYGWFRIDVVEEFDYDMLDNDEIWESNDDGNVSGEYKHPFFFAKLRPLGFNLFDLALQDDMVLSMTTGQCGACNFRIGVDENTGKNPVQIWEYNVYGGPDYNNRGTMLYAAGSLMRYVDTSTLYYDTNGTDAGYIPVSSSAFATRGITVYNGSSTFVRTVYSAASVINGEVGSLKQDPKNHTEGDVKVSGKFIASQQDTTENYVWIALYKDTDTYGTIMPSARPDYDDDTYSVYIRPKSVADVHTSGSTYADDDENADKFVLVNIRMPQVYLRYAERELSKKLVENMNDNNYQKFNFSINHSRIFLEHRSDVESNLNENSVVYVNFNRRVYRQYVQHYTYKMSREAVLPEISVDMNEELSVSRTKTQRDRIALQRQESAIARIVSADMEARDARIMKRTVSRGDDVLVSGNFVSRDGRTSVSDLSTKATGDAREIDSLMGSRESTKDFVRQSNTFNAGIDERMKQIRQTVETRLLPVAEGVQEPADQASCQREEQHYAFTPTLSTPDTIALLWLDKDGGEQTYTKTSGATCPVDQGMTDISWTEFNFQ